MDKFVIKINSAGSSCVIDENCESTSTTTVSEEVKDDDDEISDFEKSEPEPTLPTIKKKKVYQQKYRGSWKQTYDFIINKNGSTWCSVCSMNLKGGGFHIKRHAHTNSHIKKYNAAKKTPHIKKVFKEGVKPLQDRIREFEMQAVSFLCEQNLPFTLADSLTDFLKGLFPEDVVVKNLKLKRKKATQLALQVLAPFAKGMIIEKLKKERFSLIVDETTHVGCKKSLAVLARYFDSDEDRVKDRFVTLIEVEDATAISLFNSIKRFLDENKIPYSNIIGFGADNASVMMGEINGLKQKLSSISPGIVVQGCTCHSLHLVASYACKKLPNTVEQFVRDIYSYFALSAKRNSELKEFQIFAQENPTKMLYPCQTRWLSLKSVSSRILQHWNSLNLYFQKAAIEDELPTANNILGALRNPAYKLYLLFLEYNLEQITNLNIEFQSEKPKITVLLSKMTALLGNVLRCFIKRGIIINNVPLLDINVNNPNNYKNLNDIYFGGKVDAMLKNPDLMNGIDAGDLHNFKMRALDFSIEIVRQIKKRFNFKDKYLIFANLFVPSHTLSGETPAISEYSFLFPCLNNLDIDKVNNEWQLISSMTDELNVSDLEIFWAKASKLKNEMGTLMFPNLMEVVKCVLALPHSSASAERTFSQFALIKNKLRNRLKIDTVSGLLSIKQYVATSKAGKINLPKNKNFYKNVDSVDSEEDVLIE